jgi:hypothetical protein
LRLSMAKSSSKSWLVSFLFLKSVINLYKRENAKKKNKKKKTKKTYVVACWSWPKVAWYAFVREFKSASKAALSLRTCSVLFVKKGRAFVCSLQSYFFKLFTKWVCELLFVFSYFCQ